MSSRHIVRRASEAAFAKVGDGYARWSIVDESVPGAVHTGFGICTLAPGGSVPTHVNWFEESVYMLSGSAVLDTSDGAYLLGEGDYGVVATGVPHGWRNAGAEPARWARMQAPQPRERFDGDTVVVPPLRHGPVRPVDPRDPRNRSFGHISPAHMEPGKQSQDLLAVSASMRTALLVYSGITVKMMVDSDLGAELSTMFMVQYEPDGVAGPHDHPFEETYLILEGATDATFDGTRYRLEPGDVAFAGVGCVHSFTNAGEGPVRWLETQAPQPPSRHSYRFARDWTYLRETVDREAP
ncbi:cupin domain-containing protein [Micromonospora sp. CPCC 206061]|uniref:cupin domain-containing protein n=1 Tax=Micromonospora sp. CPCC 206061 TaxID=3122410 RepID=UPI002FF2637B